MVNYIQSYLNEVYMIKEWVLMKYIDSAKEENQNYIFFIVW